jgi:hypothetical protein
MVRLIAPFLMTVTAFGQNAASEETQIWNLETAYWDYVKANDLEKHRALWHEDFVGWPLFSPPPCDLWKRSCGHSEGEQKLGKARGWQAPVAAVF